MQLVTLIVFFFSLQDAENSIRFYKNIDKTHENCDKIIQQEIRKLRTTIADDQNANDIKASVKWSDFTTKIARKALILGIVLVMLYIWNGVYGLSGYIATIFQQTGSTLSPNMSAIVLGVCQIVGFCIAAATVDRCGRKVFLMNHMYIYFEII